MALVPHCETPYRQRSALLLATKIAGDGYTMKRKNAGRKARRDSSPVMNSGMPRALGVRLISLRKRKVVAEMRVKPMHINRSGRVNGGALMAFADVMGAAGTVYNLPPGHRTGTLESKTNFFRAGEGPVLRAISIPLHIGRTTMVWQTTIRNSDRSVVAIVTQTQIVLPAKGDE
jgi:1,4-dihydroxy-2-naphthoyl-CoA hydrolase